MIRTAPEGMSRVMFCPVCPVKNPACAEQLYRIIEISSVRFHHIPHLIHAPAIQNIPINRPHPIPHKSSRALEFILFPLQTRFRVVFHEFIFFVFAHYRLPEIAFSFVSNVMARHKTLIRSCIASFFAGFASFILSRWFIARVSA